MISYGGVPLICSTPQLKAWVERFISTKDVYEFQQRTWPGKRKDSWPFPGHVPLPPIKLGHLYWPTGASRWAVGHFVIAEEDLAALTAQAYSGGALAAALPFVMQDGIGGSITTNLWMLPPRPLSQFPGGAFNGMYLLTLVDDRFWWHSISSGDIFPIGTATWADLLGLIQSALGITLTYSAIESSYLAPASSLDSRHESVCLLLDAVCFNIQRKLVRSLNGTVSLQTATEAESSVSAQLATAWDVLAGGKIDKKQIAFSLPSTVKFIFPKTAGDVLTKNIHVATVIVSDINFGLGVSVTGILGTTKLFHDHAVASYPTGADTALGPPLNSAELSALATIFATTWCRFRLANLDIVWAGIRPWAPEGMSDCIEWIWSGDGETSKLATRVQRPTWNDLTEEMNHRSATSPGDEDIPDESDTHNLLSTTHPDTVPYTPPVKGDLIVGTYQGGESINVKWSKFGVGAKDQVLSCDSSLSPGVKWRDLKAMQALTWNVIKINSKSNLPDATDKSKFRMDFATGYNQDSDLLGFTGGIDGQLLYLVNATPKVIVMKHKEGIIAGVGKWLYCPDNHDYNLRPQSGCILEYSSELSAWLFDCQEVGYVGLEINSVALPHQNILNLIGTGGISITGTNDPANYRSIVQINGSPGIGKDFFYWRYKYPKLSGVIPRYYIAGLATGRPKSGSLTLSYKRGFIYLMPLVCSGSGTVEEIAVRVNFSVAAEAKVAIYDNTADSTLYPLNLLKKSNQYNMPFGVGDSQVFFAINHLLNAGNLYWIAILFHQATSNFVSAWVIPDDGAYGVLGHNCEDWSVLNQPGVGWEVDYTANYWDGTEIIFPTEMPKGGSMMNAYETDSRLIALAVHFMG